MKPVIYRGGPKPCGHHTGRVAESYTKCEYRHEIKYILYRKRNVSTKQNKSNFRTTPDPLISHQNKQLNHEALSQCRLRLCDNYILCVYIYIYIFFSFNPSMTPKQCQSAP